MALSVPASAIFATPRLTIGTDMTLDDLEQEISRPSQADIDCLRRLDGDILILGAGGKMGPSLARLCRRAADGAGVPRRIFAVSRNMPELDGVQSLSCA